ncbi:NAD-dependent epimerase/dehydratase family protein [Cellulomonas sp. IC4_254]|uniref:NAD-dependent epimerase/dehydratase family protein n=1 Tax=Cellulomonas sp. IC4_254 TaxID=2714040 RepID=UPI001421E054|nr:NAD-dependent epimerase/dehydratase family protein [Cellulomonas sp. IC4_254]NHT16088.1 NAD-dependent epimerase/dehydratase family protein [Cellulomonas sp. IC4_254]
MTDIDPTAPVLVTGGSGFIAGHCILQLLAQGRPVRTTLRSLAREAEVRTVLAEAGVRELGRLEVVAADLDADAGWDEAVRGTAGVLHVASPVTPGHVEEEDELIVPAREGALRVLRAARDARVPRVVLTSAFHAVGFGHGRVDHVFTEDDWSPLDGPGMDAYGRSKVLAERAAWDDVRVHGGPELVTILPVAVLGPVMGDAVSGTNRLLQRILTGALPGFPDLAIPFVDVRDVAAAHIAALDRPEAAGLRVLVASQDVATPLREVGAVLREALGDAAHAVPTRNIPSILIRAGAAVRPEMREIAPELGYVKRLSTARARDVLGLTPRPWTEAVVAGARSMIDKGLVEA